MQFKLMSEYKKTEVNKDVKNAGGLVGTGVTAFILAAGLLFTGSVIAESQPAKSGKMEYAYSLNDGSIQGRYGDEHADSASRSSVSVSVSPMTEETAKKLPRKLEGKMGAFSVKDGAREGYYGDGFYGVSDE